MLQLKSMSKELIMQLTLLKDRYEKSTKPRNKKDEQLFIEMKEETAPIYTLLQAWKTHALQAIKSKEIFLHPQQINATKENIELILLHSYYSDVRRKRYMQIQQSCYYILKQIIEDIEENGDETTID